MIHHRINDNDHWGVSYTGYIEELPKNIEPKVLVQLQQNNEQVRVGISAEEAEYMAAELLKFASKVREGIDKRRENNR